MLEHDDIVDLIKEEMEDRGFDVHTFENYTGINGCGEIDLYAIKDKYVFVFEVKKTDSIRHFNHAYHQLKRIEQNCFKKYKMFKFYAYGKGSEYHVEWVKQKF